MLSGKFSLKLQTWNDGHCLLNHFGIRNDVKRSRECIFVGSSCAVYRESCRILTAVYKMFKTSQPCTKVLRASILYMVSCKSFVPLSWVDKSPSGLKERSQQSMSDRRSFDWQSFDWQYRSAIIFSQSDRYQIAIGDRQKDVLKLLPFFTHWIVEGKRR